MTPEKLKALIVDDESLARSDLIAVLNELGEEMQIFEADSIHSARNQLDAILPDVIFLDIQMPGETGFDLLKFIDPSSYIIFVTAFDEYAIQAFEVNALDYLLKPVNPLRLQKALDRIKMPVAESGLQEKKLNIEDSVFLKLNDEYRFLKVQSILKIESAGDYTKVHLKNGDNMITHKSMKEWETRLPDQMFCRIHRSSIVNYLAVKKIEPWFNHAYMVYLEGIEEPQTMSRRYFSNIKEKMG